MTTPYARTGFPREENLAELYHENTKIRPYMRDAEEDPAGASVDLPPPESLAYGEPEDRLPLPAPLPLRAPLGEILAQRRSRRAFAPDPLSLAEVATLLHAAYGVSGPLEGGEPGRSAPSAGARYPLELFPVARRVESLAPGVRHYHPETHSLEKVPGRWRAEDLLRALFDVPWLRDAALVVLVGAVFPRTLAKYRERGYRLVLLDAGHAAQNLLLAAQGLGLHAAPVAGFVDDELNALVGLNGMDENVLLALAIGRPPA